MKKIVIENVNDVEVCYAKMVCPICKHTWGANVYSGKIEDKQCVCQKCAVDRYLAEKK